MDQIGPFGELQSLNKCIIIQPRQIDVHLWT